MIKIRIQTSEGVESVGSWIKIETRSERSKGREDEKRSIGSWVNEEWEDEKWSIGRWVKAE